VLQREPLDARPLEAAVRRDADGAVVTFSGVTRDHNEGASVLGLEYEAYDEMAEAEMGRLFEEAIARFGDGFGRARVAHRLGPVPIGEASVLVVVSAPHRGPAFEAARWLMDRLKERVPIFKKERLAERGGGGERWVGDLPRP
jgi:molybdopterin synthase catalytic subunit